MLSCYFVKGSDSLYMETRNNPTIHLSHICFSYIVGLFLISFKGALNAPFFFMFAKFKYNPVSCKFRGFIQKLIYTLNIHSIRWKIRNLLGSFYLTVNPSKQLRGFSDLQKTFKLLFDTNYYASKVGCEWF